MTDRGRFFIAVMVVIGIALLGLAAYGYLSGAWERSDTAHSGYGTDPQPPKHE